MKETTKIILAFSMMVIGFVIIGILFNFIQSIEDSKPREFCESNGFGLSSERGLFQDDKYYCFDDSEEKVLMMEIKDIGGRWKFIKTEVDK